MRSWASMLVCVAVVGCNTGGDSDAGGDTNGSDTEATDGTNDAAPCAVLEAGSYTAKGSCFGMKMGADLAFDVDSCTFTFDNWSMDMSVNPDGGTVDGDDVTMTGGGMDGCTGTIDGGTMQGVCDDGCAWTFTFSE